MERLVRTINPKPRKHRDPQDECIFFKDFNYIFSICGSCTKKTHFMDKGAQTVISGRLEHHRVRYM